MRRSTSLQSIDSTIEREIIPDKYQDVIAVGQNIDAVTTVAADLNEDVSEIDTVAANIVNVNYVGDNINAVLNLDTNMQDIQDIANDLNGLELDGVTPKVNQDPGNSAIDGVAGILADVSRVAEISDDVVEIATTYPNVIGNPTEGTSFMSILHHALSSTFLHGGDITDNLDGTVDLAVGSARIRQTPATEHTDISTAEVPAKTLTLAEGNNYVYATLSELGVPSYEVTSDISLMNMLDNVAIYSINNDSGSLHIVDARFSGIDHVAKHQRYMYDTSRFERVHGSQITDNGDLGIYVGSGRWYFQLNPIDTPAISGTTFEYYYVTAGVWTEVDSTVVDQTQYNDTATGLVAVGVNKFVPHWVYLLIDSFGNTSYAVVYGDAEYPTLDTARQSTAPSSLPPSVLAVGTLVGRVITRQGDVIFQDVGSAFAEVFGTTIVTDHNDLANLQGGDTLERYHLTAAEHTKFQNIDTQIQEVAVANAIAMSIALG